MPFAAHEGDQIHFETFGDGGIPLIIQHGLYSNASELSYPQFIDAVSDTFQMIFIDSLGHGESDGPHEIENYEPEHRAGDITAVLDALGVGKAHYFGYSMGGWLGGCMAKHAPDRLKSLCVAGWPVDLSGPEDLTDELFDEIWTESKRALFFDNARAFGRLNPETEPPMKNCLRAVLENPKASDALKALGVPVMMACGEEDQLFEGAKKVAGEIGVPFMPLPGNHGEAINKNLGFYFPDIAEFFLKAEG